MKKFSLAAMLIFGMAGAAHAQKDSIDTQKTVQLPQVVVTAPWKSLSVIEELPVSNSVLPYQKLASENLTNITDLSARIPNLYMPRYGSRLTAPVYIRGIGSRINAPSVGLYVDDVPYFEKAMYRLDLDNVKRVEVLRGPQGTLYGRNTQGGVINVETFSPFDMQSTRVGLSAAAFDALAARATLQKLVTDRLGLTLGAGYKHERGDFKNTTLNKYTARVDEANANLKLEYRPGNLWRMTYTGTFMHTHQDGYPYAPMNAETGRVQNIAYDEPSSYRQTLTTHALHLRRETERTLFTSVTAFQWIDDEQRLDQDFTANRIYYAVQSQKQYMISQEFVLRSNRAEARYEWLTGAYAFAQHTDGHIDVDNHAQQAAEYRITDIGTRGAAVFHQSRLNNFLLPRLSLEAGLRVDAERAEMDYDYTLVMGETSRPSPRVNSELDFVKLVPRVSLMYRLNRHLLYASFSCGYKTGGFNNAFELDDDRSFDPENSLNYEVGYRTQNADNAVNLDLSFFYIDWRNQQIYAINPSGRGSVLRNAGRSHSTGLEATISLSPLPRLNLDATYGYTYAVFDRNVRSESIDYSGNHIPHTPRNTLSLTGHYDLPHTSGFVRKTSLMLGCNAVGEIYWDETNQASQPLYAVLNAQVAFHLPAGCRFSLWGRNLTNTYYNVFHFSVGTSNFGQQGMPLTVGGTFNATF